MEDLEFGVSVTLWFSCGDLKGLGDSTIQYLVEFLIPCAIAEFVQYSIFGSVSLVIPFVHTRYGSKRFENKRCKISSRQVMKSNLCSAPKSRGRLNWIPLSTERYVCISAISTIDDQPYLDPVLVYSSNFSLAEWSSRLAWLLSHWCHLI